MDDRQIIEQIGELAEEERHLHAAHVGDGLDEPGRLRLRKVEIEIDRLWDLLRQRRALRKSGGDPQGAHERSADEVEDYLQ
jgi:hypothetical protein